MNIVELETLYLMKRNQIDMMRIRGYKIESEDSDIYDMDIDQFEQYMETVKDNSFVDKILAQKGARGSIKDVFSEPRGLLSYEYAKEGKKNYTCAVVYITRKDQGRGIEKPFTSFLVNFLSAYTEIIFISNRPLTQDSRSIVNSIPVMEKGVPRSFWLFRDEELYTNPLAHKLCPRHELLSDEESIQFKKRYHNPTLISTEDPVVKFHGWKVNNVVKITRDVSSLNAGIKELVTKRLIVKSAIVRDIVE